MGLIDNLMAMFWDSPATQAAKHNAAVKLAAANTMTSGPGVRQRRTAVGTRISFQEDTGGSFSSQFFKASVTRRQEVFEVRFQRGFIGGVEPSINGLGISRKGDDGRTPALIVRSGDFDPDEGICGIYFRCEVDHDSFAIRTITPVASAAKPKKEAWVAFKLAGFLIRSGATARYDRSLFSNLGFYPANRKTNGFFDALFFWAT